MATVNEALKRARLLTDSKNLRQVLSFKQAFGFIFSSHKEDKDMGNVCIMISKSNPDEYVLVPIVNENIPFLQSGKDITSTIK